MIRNCRVASLSNHVVKSAYKLKIELEFELELKDCSLFLGQENLNFDIFYIAVLCKDVAMRYLNNLNRYIAMRVC